MKQLYNVTASGSLFGYSIEEFNGFLNRLKAPVETLLAKGKWLLFFRILSVDC
jgi:hypothetical protein